MPFTLSHPAAILLLRGTPLPVAAMVAGSMAPDAPMFLRLRGAYDVTHSLFGVLTVDLALSVVAVLFWFRMLRDPLVDLVPAIRERLEPTVRYSSRQWALVVPAAVLGSLTHLAWDSFTHHGRWGAERVPLLRDSIAGHYGSEWAQYGSSVLGLLVVAGWGLLAVRARPRTPRPATVPGLGLPAVGAVLVLTVGSGVTAAITTAAPGIRMWLGQAAVVGTIIGAFCLLVVACVWRVRLGGRDRTVLPE
ncbi:DUF4184 family protein [Nocardioides marmoriginsengisoli]|uniref:DUF4184 family protein n=1 Tax=Nocardioides marmoriginsengisoli TaxID=661483 RepID=A0A3N0CAC3_9ACTN|nr:DUF4184 family protein [Nocardioides marmoriginsengisoli]RNL60407.1 DUF4184 family protein [Nocardioides marmoriginsengisoli]